MTTDFSDEELREALLTLSEEELSEVLDDLSPLEAERWLTLLGDEMVFEVPDSPLSAAVALQPNFRVRSHLEYLSERIRQAVVDVENGRDRRIIIEMPPRTGKSNMTTLVAPSWMLQRNPSWEIALTSHDGSLATSWGRAIRRWVESGALGPDVAVAPDAGAAAAWETTAGGKLLSLSIRESFTGRGAKILVIDDPHKDFVDAHSKTMRDNVWNWWLSVAQTRLQPPSLVLVIMTRWHEDDFVGRLLSKDYEGDPEEWERITMPAISNGGDDLLGRTRGEPLLSPLVEESMEEATKRWDGVRRSVGTYTFSAMYQQSPAPSEGSVFNIEWWKYWTNDPSQADSDARTVLLSEDVLSRGRWVDSWDTSFKNTETSDYVVGQRWVKSGANRYLIAQQRGRWSFVETLEAIRRWALTNDEKKSPYGARVHERLIESAANGPAIIDSLRSEVSGIKAIKATSSKESRARSVTPEIESGNVYLPHPSMPGFEWVADLISELRNFPHDTHDDMVDSLTQALMHFRGAGSATISVPHGVAGGAEVRRGNPVAGRYSSARSMSSRRIPVRGEVSLRLRS